MILQLERSRPVIDFWLVEVREHLIFPGIFQERRYSHVFFAPPPPWPDNKFEFIWVWQGFRRQKRHLEESAHLFFWSGRVLTVLVFLFGFGRFVDGFSLWVTWPMPDAWKHETWSFGLCHLYSFVKSIFGKDLLKTSPLQNYSHWRSAKKHFDVFLAVMKKILERRRSCDLPKPFPNGWTTELSHFQKEPLGSADRGGKSVVDPWSITARIQKSAAFLGHPLERWPDAFLHPAPFDFPDFPMFVSSGL